MAAAGIATAAAVALLSLNGMVTVAGATWCNALIVAVGSLLVGLVAGSYFRAPIGAEATVCDTRWPVLGLTGLVLATSTGQRAMAAQLFTGASPAVLARVIDPPSRSSPLPCWAVRCGIGSNSSETPYDPPPMGAVHALPVGRSFPPNPVRLAARPHDGIRRHGRIQAQPSHCLVAMGAIAPDAEPTPRKKVPGAKPNAGKNPDA